MISSLDLASLRTAYRSGQSTPSQVVTEVYRRIAERGLRPIWISLVAEQDAIAAATALEQNPENRKLPLYGVPFAVKDNMDVAGMETTAGCPSYAHRPAASATTVQRLIDAGAILIGKTNLDQFATGLVGVRSPYGACSSVFDARYISGGSSSGSAVAVASSLVTFSLGTDTAGSGRVPAAFNNLIGMKPTRGALSAAGVVPACRTLDCVSIFALTSSDALAVLNAAAGHDPLDGFSRVPGVGEGAAPWLNGKFRFGFPAAEQREFFADKEAAKLYERAIQHLIALGGEPVEVDLAPFRAAADLLYSGPWVAERLAAIQEFVRDHGKEMDPTVHAIISGAGRYTAVDAYRAQYKLADLRQKCVAALRGMDVLLLPTTGPIYTIEEVRAEPVRLNTNLGYYTNFVNLLDLAAVAVPAGFRSNGLPFGVSLIGAAWTDTALLHLGDRFHQAIGGKLGGTPTLLRDVPALPMAETPPGCVLVAVVGAHLSGQPLNWQLMERGARLVRSCRTARGYRLYALGGTVPPKPGLVRDASFSGTGVELEIWAMPEDRFGGFVAAIPPPLAIGSAELEDGKTVKCFVCEPSALANAEEVTRYGGWRAYLSR